MCASAWVSTVPHGGQSVASESALAAVPETTANTRTPSRRTPNTHRAFRPAIRAVGHRGPVGVGESLKDFTADRGRVVGLEKAHGPDSNDGDLQDGRHLATCACDSASHSVLLPRLRRPSHSSACDLEHGQNIDEVVVTGTRVASRSRLDSLAPVDVIAAESLNTQATTELAEALSNTAPSLNFPRPSITDGTDHIRPATLRGLAPDQTLVLVNSKRRHQSALVNVNGSIGRGSAAVDLNAIPLASVESMEVLRDGASAQYGSDAIAGVINLRLREAAKGATPASPSASTTRTWRPSAASARKPTAPP